MKNHARKLISFAGMTLLTALPPALGQTGQSEPTEETQGVTMLRLRAEGGRIIAETEGGKRMTAGTVQLEGADGVLQTLSARGDLLQTTYQNLSTQTPKVQIGVTMEPVAGALAAQLGLEPESAVLISGVTEGQPADKAGLKQHDVVTAVNGESPVTQKSFRQAVAASSPGDTITLSVVRGGKRLKIEVEVEAFARPKLTANDLAYTYLAGQSLRGVDITKTVEPTVRNLDVLTTLNRPVQVDAAVTTTNSPHVWEKLPLLSYYVNRAAEAETNVLLETTPVVVEGQVTLVPRVVEGQVIEEDPAAALSAEVRRLKAQLDRIEGLLEKLEARRD